MARGRPPKPVHVRKAEGNPGKRPLPEIPRVSPIYEAPPPPESLGPSGRATWSVVADSLAPVGALQRHHLPLLLLFAQAIELTERAWTELQAAPLVRQGRGGGVNPHVRVWRDAAATARSLGEGFGVSPRDMARLGLVHVRGLSVAQELAAQVSQARAQSRRRPPRGGGR